MLFPRFPFKASDIAESEGKKASSNRGANVSSDQQVDTLLRQIGALALVIAKTRSKFKHGEKPNANQIAEAVGEILDASPDLRVRGLKSSSIRKSIQQGIERLQK